MDQEINDHIPGPEFGVTDRALAAVVLVVSVGLVYICADILMGGRMTRALAAAPELPGDDA